MADKAPLLVVDGDSIFFRAFFALPSSIKGADGRPVNALLGAANLILRVVEDHSPRAVVVCFGQEAAHYRKELYEPYHAQRPELDPDLAHQYTLVKDWLEAFGWTVAGHEALEADDLLASYAEAEAERGGRALIMTGDRDMFQCAGERVQVLYVSTGKNMQLMGPAEVEERYRIPPALVPDFIALRGDPSDGIPGAKGIGEKTAADLLRKYGSLEDTMRAAARGETTPSVRKALLDDTDLILAFKHIATVQVVKVTPPNDTPLDRERASARASALGMNALAKRLAAA
ncbi:MAG TPA: 5'-3' exonuclease H3TH domain-containing protein [Thermoleophilaceae bacterium]|nr:5'-3' exonuclease H3TH domain-containing protein [Thermoleophilaceae bacterium]